MILRATASNGQIQSRIDRLRKARQYMEKRGLNRVFTRHDADGHVTYSQYPDGEARSDAQRAKVMRSVSDPRQRAGENLRLYLSRLRVAAALMKP